MKLRLRPLRGQMYHTKAGTLVTILENVDGLVRVETNGFIGQILISQLNLPIIDTKDYEKIEDTKYKGD